MKVLFLLDQAPDYREGFLRELARHCELTVLAHPCETAALTPPRTRAGYEYIECRKSVGGRVRADFELEQQIERIKPSIICVALNLRFPLRIATFLLNPEYRNRWVWWGQVFGVHDNLVMTRLKRFLLRRAGGVLVYTDDIVRRLKGIDARSFDNSQFSEADFKRLDAVDDGAVNCLFVGRPQPRKRLHLIMDIARRFPRHNFRLVGPGMREYFAAVEIPTNVALFPAADGDDLERHFRWARLVVNPGHAGLLVMNAACHNRPILIDSQVKHAPEVILAREADQYFIDFDSDDEVDRFFDVTCKEAASLASKGQALYDKAMDKYTVEKMAQKHMTVFEQVLERCSGCG
ncbi:MAG: hypothetical protein ACNA7W_12280 [Pseudomonadales bacterium]